MKPCSAVLLRSHHSTDFSTAPPNPRCSEFHRLPVTLLFPAARRERDRGAALLAWPGYQGTLMHRLRGMATTQHPGRGQGGNPVTRRAEVSRSDTFLGQLQEQRCPITVKVPSLKVPCPDAHNASLTEKKCLCSRPTPTGSIERLAQMGHVLLR
ncbi:hypothetical protein AAFF_G00269740 [Aldrovandia affinis]|uniref:Uncharacterized protein n=1 Tax=Aldrovandia affinis TaxID=143900 RepID=A0AAD7SSD9_9TELE|nr:hypothetical protein AAFF_G00269740 [Aldrovandia affinis]